MKLSNKALKIHSEINRDETKLGDLRKMADTIKKDHVLATELWSTGDFLPRLLAILIMDKNELSVNLIDSLIGDIQLHAIDDRIQLADWLMANQLSKDKKAIAIMQSWQNSDAPIKRRLFWYYQGRLRWVGQTPPNNTQDLLSAIQDRMLSEVPEVQWAMNFTAAWIGIFDQENRSKCIKMGEKLGLYKDKVVAKNCSPNYLPKLIQQEVQKRNL